MCAILTLTRRPTLMLTRLPTLLLGVAVALGSSSCAKVRSPLPNVPKAHPKRPKHPKHPKHASGVEVGFHVRATLTLTLAS